MQGVGFVTAWILGLLLTAYAFACINLHVSGRMGRLCSVSNYDDVVYLNKAAHIYFKAKRESMAAAATELFARNLHAPFSLFNGLLFLATELNRPIRS